jgi:hypothetical protein
MLGNLLLDYDFISCRQAMKAALYLALETCDDFVQLQSREHGRVHPLNSSVTNI